MDTENGKDETVPETSETITTTSSSKSSLWLGVGLLLIIIAMVVLIPCPSQSQYLVFRIVIALMAAGLAAIIPGFIKVNIKKGITAGGAIAIFALIYFFDPASTVAENNCAEKETTFSLTVFVHGTRGEDDKMLRGQGVVCIYLNSNPEKVKIDDDGKAIFTEISPTFLNSKVRITVQHPQPYQSVHPDSMYVLQRNGVINLDATLNNIDKLFGRVVDGDDDPLDSVKIIVKNVHTFSNSEGWFELEVPKEWQSKFQRVSFSKKGYMRQDIDSIPVHIKQEIQVSLKKK